EPIYDSAFLGYDFPLDVDLIERVEVIRGPGSSLYGNNAFFGIINVVTRSGREIGGQGIEAAASYGRFDSYSGRFSYGRQFINDDRNRLWDERAYIEARYEHDFTHDWHLMARAYYDHYTYEGTFVYDYMDPQNPAPVVNRDTPLARWWGGEVQTGKTLWKKHH